MHCLLADSPPDTPEEIAAIGRNQDRVASQGREPGLLLENASGSISLKKWAAEILEECIPIANALDAANLHNPHANALRAAQDALADPKLLPSARMLQKMATEFSNSYTGFIKTQSIQSRNTLLNLPYPEPMAERFKQLAQNSVQEQKRIESTDTIPFDIYLKNYLSADKLNV